MSELPPVYPTAPYPFADKRHPPRARIPLEALKGPAKSRTISLPQAIWGLLTRDAHRRGLPTSALVRLVLLNFYADDDDQTLSMPDSLREVR